MHSLEHLFMVSQIVDIKLQSPVDISPHAFFKFEQNIQVIFIQLKYIKCYFTDGMDQFFRYS